MFGIGGCEEVTSSIFWAHTGARKSEEEKRNGRRFLLASCLVSHTVLATSLPVK